MALANTSKSGSRVVVLGGGNGTSRLLSSLLPFYEEGKIASLHALVHMADDGGSTGRLRDQYAVGAMGDLTKCLMALSGLRGDVRGDEFLRALEYRFDNGDFKGHTLRNAFLAALELTSDLDSAIATMARVLQVPKYTGVIPTTLTPLTQQVTVKGEVVAEGEHFIAHNVDLQNGGGTAPSDVKVVFKEKEVVLNPRAQEALSDATHVLVAPGHTYGSILPALASLSVNGASPLFSAKVGVVMTLLTTPHQTTGWSGEDFVEVYESYLGRKVDFVVANEGKVDASLVEGQDWVLFDEKDHPYTLLKKPVVRLETAPVVKSDTVPRAIVAHDEEVMRDVLKELL